MIQRHRLPRDALTALCAGAGSSTDITLLWSGQLSKRLLQLRAIVEAAGCRASEAGRLAQLEDSYRSLVLLQRYQPHIVAELLMAPQVGAWTACCLRRLTIDHIESDDRVGSAPLWVDLAQLGAITAAAAFRTGIELLVTVPVRAGVVTLPTVGQLTVPSRGRWELACFELATGLARVRLADHLLILPGRWRADSAGWEPVRWLHTRTDGVSQVVELDDLDPYWRCLRLPLAARLRPDKVRRWRSQLSQAWQLLAARHPERLAALRTSIRTLVPLASKQGRERLSASSRHTAGALALTEPVHEIDMATTLVHEVQHFKLNALHDLQPLYHPDDKRLYYSPWRPDPRPLPGLMHGVYAFLGVAEFMHHEHAEGALRDAQTEMALACCIERLRVGYQQIIMAPELTSLGRELTSTLGLSITRLNNGILSDNIQRRARKLVSQHRAEWQTRHGSIRGAHPYDEGTSMSQSTRR